MPTPAFQHLLPPYILRSETYLLIITDLQGNYIFVNDLFKKRFNFLGDTIIGKGNHIAVHPEDVDICTQAAMECILYPDKIVQVQVRKPNQSMNDFYWTHWEFSLFKDENQEPIGILCIGHDITESEKTSKQAKLSEIMLHAIFDSGIDGHVFIDTNFKILYFNKIASDLIAPIFGKSPIIGEDCFLYVPTELNNIFKENLERAKKGEIIYIEHFENGKWLLFKLFPVYNENKIIIGVFCNMIDITYRKYTELKILAQNELLKTITWQQSHAVRGPLANILGMITLIEMEKEQGYNARYLRYLRQSADELDAVIRKIVAESTADESLLA